VVALMVTVSIGAVHRSFLRQDDKQKAAWKQAGCCVKKRMRDNRFAFFVPLRLCVKKAQ
jgi:hypothetical protein